MSHYYTVIQPKDGLFPYRSIKVLSDNSKSFEHGNMHCLKIECLRCGRTYFPCCEPADCEIFEAGNTVFSDAEMEEISRIIRDYKERKMAKSFVEKEFEAMRLWAIEHRLVDEFDKEITERLLAYMNDKNDNGMAALFGYFVLEHSDYGDLLDLLRTDN